VLSQAFDTRSVEQSDPHEDRVARNGTTVPHRRLGCHIGLIGGAKKVTYSSYPLPDDTARRLLIYDNDSILSEWVMESIKNIGIEPRRDDPGSTG
jgi:hypothetical protein